jgi:tetratricopeptide (TPR) repeat protein
MDKARALDQSIVDKFFEEYFPKMAEGMAQRLMDSANRSFRLKNWDNAKKYASFILTKFEGTKVEPEAEALLDKIEAKRDEEATKKAAQRRLREAEAEATAAKIETQQIDAYLKPVESLIAQANKDNNRGLRAKTVSKSKGPLEAAAKKFERAVREADKALEKGAPDTQTEAHMKELRAEAVEGGVQAYLNLANSMSARGSYQKGVAYCNQALALDPDNAEAKRTRQVISTTTAGWGRRR